MQAHLARNYSPITRPLDAGAGARAAEERGLAGEVDGRERRSDVVVREDEEEPERDQEAPLQHLPRAGGRAGEGPANRHF